MSGNPEKPPIVPDQTTGNEEYPPPPPGAPDLPPAYSTGEQHQPPPEKGGLPQYHQDPVPEKQQHHAPSRVDSGVATAFYRSSDQYDGPPPPLPGPRPTQQHDAIPAYNPANPQFASPPGAQQYPNAHSTPHQEAPLAEQDGSRRNLASILTEIGQKAAGPINAIANKLGSQSFLPTTMDKECFKAAQILRSFCKEGITSDAEAVNPNPADTKPEVEDSAAPGKQKQRRDRGAIVKIPSKVIAKAQGLAIFTTARVGFNFSGATGSGILISRLPDGRWSPPSGIQVHALGAGFMFGLDIYDCVCVINSKEALSAFMSTRVSLGPDVAVTAGPWGAGGMVDFGSAFQSDEDRRALEAQRAQLKQQQPNDHVHDKPSQAGTPGTAGTPEGEEGKLKPQKGYQRRNSSMAKPVFSYVKSRGFYAGVTVDGTIITERKDANAAFYGQRVSVEQILNGQVPAHGPAWPAGGQPLYEALRIAEAQQPLPDANMPAPPPPADEKPVPSGPADQQHTVHPLQSHPPTIQPAPSAAGGQQPAANPLQSQVLQSHPTTSDGTSKPGDELPAYQDDGVERPGDQKVHFS